MKSVLLTGPTVPFESVWDENFNDMAGSRLTRGQGPFTIKSHGHYWALYYIAENINAPVTVLENPSMEDFEAEIAKGYDYWGLQLKAAFFEKAIAMIRAARRISPKTKIVVGGYGVAALHDPLPNDPDDIAGSILEEADHICHGEGVAFFRGLLGDEPLNRPATQFTLPLGSGTIPGLERIAQFYNAIVVAALGCPGGCDFCATSHFFKKEKIRLLTAKQCYETMAAYSKRLGWRKFHCTVYDEDLLRDADYVRELGSYIRDSKDANLDRIKYLAFGSIQALEQYDISELQTHGIDSVWVGVESTLGDGLKSDYPDIAKKHKGRNFEQAFGELHDNGIVTTGSLILGFDFHDKENILKDIDRFVKLKPVFYQIGPLLPCPGTELYRNLKKQGRLSPEMGWKNAHLFGDRNFQMKNFQPGEMKKYFDLIHDRLYEENGPSFLGSLDVNLRGYKKIKDIKDGPMRRRADAIKESCQVFYTSLAAVKEFATGKGAQERVREVEDLYKELFGDPSDNQNMLSNIFLNAVRDNMKREHDDSEVPSPRWTYYRQDGKDIRTVKGHMMKAGKAK